jgi:hypothetical protein
MLLSVAGYVAEVSGGMLGTVPTEYLLDWCASSEVSASGHGSWVLDEVHFQSAQF